LLEAEDPTEMIFQDLPGACGMRPFSSTAADEPRAEDYVLKLKAGLDELRAAYPTLINRLSSQIGLAFGYEPGEGTSPELAPFRRQLAERAGALLPLVADVELKGFCQRIWDAALESAAWIESFGSFVAATPPSRWKNQDEFAFSERLHALASKFKRTEAAFFAATAGRANAKRVLVTITQGDGSERTQVLHLTEAETEAVNTLKTELAARLGRNKQVFLTALSELTWDLMGEGNE
jgi:hypothetical protein